MAIRAQILLFALAGAPLLAQQYAVVNQGSDPTGNTCSDLLSPIIKYSGKLYTCQSGAYAQASGGSGGGGTPGGSNGQIQFNNAGAFGGITTIPAANMPAFTGDVTTSAGSTNTQLATQSGVTPGTYQFPNVTTNSKGIITAITNGNLYTPTTESVTTLSLTGAMNGQYLYNTAASATWTIASAPSSLGAGWYIPFKQATNSTLTISAPSSYTIDPGTGVTPAQNFTISTQGEACVLYINSAVSNFLIDCGVGGGGTPGGSNGQIQFNNAGAFGGYSTLPAGVMPAFAGDINTSAGSTATSSTCSIAAFNPHADGVTNDYTAFNSAQSACGNIMLTQGKTYFIGTNMTLSSAITFSSTSSTSASQIIVGTGVTLTLNGSINAPLNKIFTIQGTGHLYFGGNNALAFPEWFGAVGNGNLTTGSGTDDTAAIQAAINVFNNATGWAGTGGAGTVMLSAKVYVVATSTPLSISIAGVSLKGYGDLSSLLMTNSATNDILDVGNPSQDAGIMISGIGFRRLTQAAQSVTISPSNVGTIGAGIALNNANGTIVDQCDFEDQRIGLYVHNSGSGPTGVIRNNQAFWGEHSVTESSGSYYGFYIDSSDGDQNASILLRDNTAGTTGSLSGVTTYSLFEQGTALNDMFLYNQAAAGTSYGIYINATGQSSIFSSQDIHIIAPILDTVYVLPIYINGISQSNRGTVDIDGGWVSPANTSYSHCIDIENSSGVSIHDMQIWPASTGSNSCIYDHNGNNNKITGNQINVAPNAISLSGTSHDEISGNHFYFPASSGEGTFVNLASSPFTTITNNVMSGYATNAIDFDSNSTSLNISGNSIDPTHISTIVNYPNITGTNTNGDGISATSLNGATSEAATGVGGTGFYLAITTPASPAANTDYVRVNFPAGSFQSFPFCSLTPMAPVGSGLPTNQTTAYLDQTAITTTSLNVAFGSTPAANTAYQWYASCSGRP